MPHSQSLIPIKHIHSYLIQAKELFNIIWVYHQPRSAIKFTRLFMTNYCIATIMLFSILSNSTYSADSIIAGNFSNQKTNTITPAGWHPLNFDSIDNKTAYFLTHDNDKVIYKAVSHASASGVINKLSINPRDYPILTWQWKIDNIITKADINSKDGDDYPARIYITFEYDVERLTGLESFKVELYKSIHGEYPPLAVLNYVWDNVQPIGYTTDNAYTKRVQMIVSQSGEKNIGKWVKERVNVYDDYQRVFGEIPMKITAVAIMTDTDNTGESATAYYGDITFSKQ